MIKNIEKAADIIKKSKHTTAFTGAGISVESGIPPFRGKDGLWSKFDPIFLDLTYFYQNPEKSWKLIKEIFYDFFGESKPNAAHYALADMEKKGIIKAVITQNIDNLHQEAGSKKVIEFHGNSRRLICTKCGKVYEGKNIIKELLKFKDYPKCRECNSLLKPDFVFFGEGIPPDAYAQSVNESEIADVFLVIGTTGEIQPASLIPVMAKRNGATIIEVNINNSNYTYEITDIFLEGKASEVLSELNELI